MVTDPPYGVEYDPGWRNRAGLGRHAAGRQGRERRPGGLARAWALFPGDVAYVWHGALHAATVAESLEACGLQIRAQIIWAKDRLVIGRGHYHWQHEPCWYAVRRARAIGPATASKPPSGRSPAGPGRGDRARHAEAGRVHAPADREQQQSGPGHLRAVLRVRHHDHCSRDDRPGAATRSS